MSASVQMKSNKTWYMYCEANLAKSALSPPTVVQMMSNKTWYMYRGSSTDDQVAELRGPSKMEHAGAPPHAEVYLKVCFWLKMLCNWDEAGTKVVLCQLPKVNAGFLCWQL